MAGTMLDKYKNTEGQNLKQRVSVYSTRTHNVAYCRTFKIQRYGGYTKIIPSEKILHFYDCLNNPPVKHSI